MRRELTCVTVATDGAAGARVRGGGAGGGAEATGGGETVLLTTRHGAGIIRRSV